MHITPRQHDDAQAAANLLEVDIQRCVHLAQSASHWLVYDRQPSRVSGSAPNEASDSERFRMVVLDAQDDQAANFAYTEAMTESPQSSDRSGIVDMSISRCGAFVFLLSYTPSLPVCQLAFQRRLTLAQLASLLIGMLALAARVKAAGYCLGSIDEESIALAQNGDILLLESKSMHARDESHRTCCKHGVSRSALIDIHNRLGDEREREIINEICEEALTSNATENALEVGMHLINQIVTPECVRIFPTGDEELILRPDTVPSNEVDVFRSEQAVDAESPQRRASRLSRHLMTFGARINMFRAPKTGRVS